MPQCFLCVKNRSALTHSIAGFLFVDAEICPKGTKQQQKKIEASLLLRDLVLRLGSNSWRIRHMHSYKDQRLHCVITDIMAVVV